MVNVLSIEQLPGAVIQSFIAGSPWAFNIDASAGALAITSPELILIDISSQVPVLASGPTPTVASKVVSVAFSASQTAALNTRLRGTRSYAFSVRALVGGQGPYELAGGELHVKPRGSTGTSTATTLTLPSLTVGAVTIPLTITLGGVGVAGAVAITPIPSLPGAATVQAALEAIQASRALDSSRFRRQNEAQRAFIDRLNYLTSDLAVMQLLGDSTGDETTEWYYQLGSKLATACPARTVQHRIWREATLDYDVPTTIQTGTAGKGYLNSTTGGVNTPDSARKSLTTCDFTARAFVRPSDFANAGDQALFGQGGGSSSPNLGWYCYLSAGALKLAISETGSAWKAFAQIASSAAVAAVVTNGVDVGLGVKVTRNSGGNVSFQAIYSTDGVTWTNFGTPYTGVAAITGAFDTNGTVDVGMRGTSTEAFLGRIYWAEAFKGLTPSTDALAWRFDASLWSTGTTFTDGEGHVWTLTGSATITAGAPVLLLMNGSKGGADIAWATTNAAALMTAPANLTLHSFGHNQDKTLTESKTFLDLIVTTNASTGVVVVRQNPTGTACTTKTRQDRQMARLGELCARQGYSTIDAYTAFKGVGSIDSYIESGSPYLHPNSAGSTLWANTAAATFGLS